MSDVRVVIKDLLPHQRYIMDNSGRFNVVCGGRRGGKSGMIEYLIYGGLGGVSVLTGSYIGLFGISRNTMTELWNELSRVAVDLVKTRDGVNRRLDFHGGGVLEFWSLENYDVSRGRKYHRSIVDEAAIHSNFGIAWQEVLRAHLVDYRGDAWFLSTPKGVGNPFHDLYMHGVNGIEGWRSFRFPTSANKLIDNGEIEDARRTLPSHIFAQEFLAEFVADDTDMWVYSFDMKRNAIKEFGGGMDRVGYLAGYPIYVSVDFNNDPLECTIWQFSRNLGLGGSFIHCIDSFSVKSKVDELGYRIREKYIGCQIYLCGDASGVQKDVGRHQTLYQIMAGALGIGMDRVKLNKKNLSYADSRILVNVMFQNYPRLVLESEELVRQVMMATVDHSSSVVGTLKKDRNKYKLDMFDSMRYFFQTYFLEFARKSYFRGVSSGLLGKDS